MKHNLEYLKRSIRVILQNHTLGDFEKEEKVLAKLEDAEKELHKKLTIAKKREKQAHQRKDAMWEDTWSGYGEAIEEFLPIKKKVKP